jgi:hypothetical protein
MRLIAGGLLKLAHGNYWLLMLFFTLPLAGLAVALMCVSRRLHGRTQYTDAFFPLALLHWYMGEYLVWGTTLNYQLPTLVAIAMLAILLRWGIQLSPGAALMAGLCLVALPLCAAGGMVYLPPFTLWLLCCGVYAWRAPSRQGKPTAVVLGVSILAALLLTGLYFHNYKPEHYGKPVHELGAVFDITVAFLTASFGRSAASFWPHSEIPFLLFLGVSIGLLALTIRRRKGLERYRAVGLLLYLGATMVMAAAVAWGRSGMGLDYIWSYWLLPVPFLLCLFVAWGLYAPRSVGYFVQMCLLVISCMTVTLNVRYGLENLAPRKELVDAVPKAVREGMPPYQLLAKYGRELTGGMGRDLEFDECLMEMRQSKIGFFAGLRPDPPFRAVPLEDLTPIELYNMERDAQTGAYSGGIDSYLTLALPKPMYVAALQITFKEDSSVGDADQMNINWRTSGAADFPADCPYYWAAAGSSKMPRPIIADTIDRIRIYPNITQPFRCKLVRVELLIPDTPNEESK